MLSSFEIMLYITSFNTIFVILCFIYVYLKEKEYQKKRDIYAQLFENITQELHFVKKNINEQKIKIEKSPKFDKNKMQESIKKQTIHILNDVLPSIIDSINQLDESFKSFKENTNSTTQELQKKVNQYSNLASYNGEDIDNRQVIKMYENGRSSEDISKKLGVSKSEIDLIIKMHNSQ